MSVTLVTAVKVLTVVTVVTKVSFVRGVTLETVVIEVTMKKLAAVVPHVVEFLCTYRLISQPQ